MVKRLDESNVEALRETEGVVYGLYKHLWMKNQQGESCHVNIPHTLVYCDSAPISWYFTSNKEEKIMRKRRDNLEGKKIAAAFMASKDANIDACCWYSGSMTHFSAILKKKEKSSPSAYDEEERDSTVEELQMETLPFDRAQDLIDPSMYKVKQEQIYDGLLQKFVEPREAADHIIRVTWSPTGSVYEKRTNRFPLISALEPLGRKVAAFNFDTWLNLHSLIGSGALITQLEKQCDNVVLHLHDISRGAIVVSRMELFFKIDKVNKIWLLFCNGLKLDRDAMRLATAPKPASLASGHIPKPARLLKDPTAEPEVEPTPVDTRPFMCAMTGEQYEGSCKMEVTYKLLIQHWFLLSSQLSSESDRIHAVDSIPPSLRRHNPNMTREYYLRHRASPSFLLSTALVCPRAAADLSRAALADTSSLMNRPVGGKGRAATVSTKAAMSSSSTLPRKLKSPPRSVAGHASTTTEGSMQSTPQIFSVDPKETAPRPAIPLILVPRTVTPIMEKDQLQKTGNPFNLGSIRENISYVSKCPTGQPGWAPTGLSGRSISPFRSASRNPVQLPRFSPDHSDAPPTLHERYTGQAVSTSSTTSGSVRPTVRILAPALSAEDMRTLKELNEACSQAEQVTQQLLAEAQELLQLPPLSPLTGLPPLNEHSSGSGSGSGRPPTDPASKDGAQGVGIELPTLGGSGSGSGSGRPPSESASKDGAQGVGIELPPLGGSGSGSGRPPSESASKDEAQGVGIELPPLGGSRQGSLSIRSNADSQQDTGSGSSEAAAAEGDLPKLDEAAASVLTTDEAELLSEVLQGSTVE